MSLLVDFNYDPGSIVPKGPSEFQLTSALERSDGTLSGTMDYKLVNHLTASNSGNSITFELHPPVKRAEWANFKNEIRTLTFGKGFSFLHFYVYKILEISFSIANRAGFPVQRTLDLPMGLPKPISVSFLSPALIKAIRSAIVTIPGKS